MSPVLSSNAPEVFPLGTTRVTWSGRDASGNVGTALQFVEIVDTTAPSLTVPGSALAECTGGSGTPVNIGSAVVDDVCWCSQVTVTNDAPAGFALGNTTVTWTATDGSGNTTMKTQDVVVQDTTAPTLDVKLTPAKLWPPDRSMVTIRASISTQDICDTTPTVRLLSITSNQLEKFPAPDIDAKIGTDDREFQLRATRSSTDDRIYTVTYEARDDSGNVTVKQAFVTVPR